MTLIHGSSRTATNIWVLSLVLVLPAWACAEENAPSDYNQHGDQTVSKSAAEPATAVTTASAQPKPYDSWTTKKLTGDWGGERTSLEESGLSFKPVYNQQFMVNMHGGKETKNGHSFAGSFELNIELDFEKMDLLPGGSFYVRAAKSTWGGGADGFNKEKIGSLFKVNGDESEDRPIYVDKWWWRQRLLDDRVEFRLGRIQSHKDLFDRSKIAGSEDKQFLNGVFVRNPTIPHKQGIGAYVNVWATDWLYLRTAAIDPQARKGRTAFDTAFHGDDRWRAFGEIGVKTTFDSPNGKLPGVYRVGSWYRPHPRSVYQSTRGRRLATQPRSGDAGFYFGCDQFLWKENDKPKDKQGLSLFARYGSARDDVNKIEHFWSVGGQYVGPVPGRDKDTVGFAIAQAILSDKYHDRVNARADRETVYELYYACWVTPWFIFTPDVQFMTNPGGDKDDRDAFVAGLRLRILF